jgi:hypothetical protein
LLPLSWGLRHRLYAFARFAGLGKHQKTLFTDY